MNDLLCAYLFMQLYFPRMPRRRLLSSYRILSIDLYNDNNKTTPNCIGSLTFDHTLFFSCINR
jgi:hypothetical protein